MIIVCGLVCRHVHVQFAAVVYALTSTSFRPIIVLHDGDGVCHENQARVPRYKSRDCLFLSK